jgi:hypothetical protein
MVDSKVGNQADRVAALAVLMELILVVLDYNQANHF